MASTEPLAKPSPARPVGAGAEALFQTHASWLLSHLRRRYGPDRAEDLLQETFLRLVRHARPLELIQPRPFLAQVARNLFKTAYRRDRRREDVDALSLPTTSPVEAADQVELVALKQVILGLPKPQRDVFVLSRFGGLSNRAIAEHLGVHVKTVEGRMTKALLHCAVQLRGRPGTDFRGR